MRLQLALYVALITIASALSIPAYAGVTNVKSPSVTKDEMEAEYKFARNGDDKKSQNNDQSHDVEISYGVSDDVSVGIEYELNNPAKGTLAADMLGLEAKWEATEQGAYFFGSGVFVSYGFAHQDTGADEAELMGIVAREYDRFGSKLNLSLEREIGENRSNGAVIKTAFSGYYNTSSSAIETVGLEWHAEYGSTDGINAISHQEHYAGPYISGKLVEFTSSALSYHAAIYTGLTRASADTAQRLEIEYSRQF